PVQRPNRTGAEPRDGVHRRRRKGRRQDLRMRRDEQAKGRACSPGLKLGYQGWTDYRRSSDECPGNRRDFGSTERLAALAAMAPWANPVTMRLSGSEPSTEAMSPAANTPGRLVSMKP